MPVVAVNGIGIYYESHGSGAPLVVLAGLGLDVSEMGQLTGPLAERFTVIAVDNRGAGRSDKPPGPYSIEQMAGDVAAVMSRAGLSRAHVLGLSMGGRIAMALALDHPELVDRLILIATSSRPSGARWLVRAGMLLADLPVLRGRHRQPRYAMKAQFGATTRFDRTSQLRLIRAPVLIIHGRSDHITPVAEAIQTHALIPGSRLLLIDGGHLAPLLGRDDRLISEITAFLTEDP